MGLCAISTDGAAGNVIVAALSTGSNPAVSAGYAGDAKPGTAVRTASVPARVNGARIFTRRRQPGGRLMWITS